jgi:hypothetical protein
LDKAVRVLVAVPGVLFGLSGLGWIFDPARAAAGLGMALPEGIARSTMIGDIGAFFLALSAMIWIGVVTLQRAWLQAAALVVGTAAVMRVLAFAVHDAAFAGLFIGVEVVVAALLIFGGNKITATP